MLSRNHPIILFIDKFGFSVYQDTLTNIPKFNFTPDLVVNQDVINKEQFTKLIETFIQINKIIGSSLAVILSDDIIFVKDLKNPIQKPALDPDIKTDSNNDKECKGEVQCFLEDIPFEEVLAKVIKAGNVNRIVAVNKDLVMTIVDTFTNKESIIEAIAPSYIFGRNANFTAGLNLNNVKVVLEDVETLKLGNLLTDQEKILPSLNLGNEIKSSSVGVKPDLDDRMKKPKNLRQYILIGIFVILLIILGIVYLNLGTSQTTPQNSKAKNVSADAISIPTIAPIIQPTSIQTLITVTPTDFKDIKIKIVQSSLVNERATNLKNELSKMGFQDIVNEISEISIPEKSSVIFSQNIPTDLRNNIIVEVKKILPDVSILESQDSNFTIKILLGKS